MDWEDSVAFSIESALTFDATAKARAEAQALREHGPQILAGLNVVADGKLGDDSEPARESWLSMIKQIEVHSPLFFKNLLEGYKEMHGTEKQISRLTARERARLIRGQVESHFASTAQRLNLMEAMEGVRSPDNRNEFTSARQAQNDMDEAMLEAAKARLDQAGLSMDAAVGEPSSGSETATANGIHAKASRDPDAEAIAKEDGMHKADTAAVTGNQGSGRRGGRCGESTSH